MLIILVSVDSLKGVSQS